VEQVEMITTAFLGDERLLRANEVPFHRGNRKGKSTYPSHFRPVSVHVLPVYSDTSAKDRTDNDAHILQFVLASSHLTRRILNKFGKNEVHKLCAFLDHLHVIHPVFVRRIASSSYR
jgi:hypothetical protein